MTGARRLSAPPLPAYDGNVSIAATKIQRPRLRAGLTMPRPTLEQRLLQALGEQRLVLLVAPAGSGKTALLVRALEQLPQDHDAAWVALDAGDDLHRLLQCLWQALEPFDLPWRISPEALATMAASADARDQQRAADEIVNTLEQGELAHGVIALDDLHHVDDPQALAFIDRVLPRLPERRLAARGDGHRPGLGQARQHPVDEGEGLGVVDMVQVVECDHAVRDLALLERVDDLVGGTLLVARLGAGGHCGERLG